jgi:hypothetical protein
MEAGAAGAAGQAAGDAGNGDAGGQEAQGQQQAALPDSLVSTLENLSTGQEELRQFLQSQAGNEGGEEEADDEDLDLSFMDPADPDFDPAQVAERLGGLIDSAAERRANALMEQRVGPLESRLDDMARTAEAERLVQEFPEFGDEKVANEVVGVSRQIAEAHGQPELADQPWFWRMTYMAARAAESANAEGDAPPAAQLEGGSGALPGGQSQADLGDAIVAGSRGGRSVLPF